MTTEFVNEGGEPIPYENWLPYCLVCKTMRRMEKKEYGYKCVSCHNEINWDLTHHE